MSVYRGGLTCLSETFSIPVTEKVYKWINNHFFVFTHVEMARVHVLRSEKRSLHTQPTLIKVMGSKFHFATEMSRNAISRPNISFFGGGGVAGRGVGWENISSISACIMKAPQCITFQTKCEQYWPESNSKLGAITVTLHKTAVFADYIIRTFLLVKVRRLTDTLLCILWFIFSILTNLRTTRRQILFFVTVVNSSLFNIHWR